MQQELTYLDPKAKESLMISLKTKLNFIICKRKLRYKKAKKTQLKSKSECKRERYKCWSIELANSLEGGCCRNRLDFDDVDSETSSNLFSVRGTVYQLVVLK